MPRPNPAYPDRSPFPMLNDDGTPIPVIPGQTAPNATSPSGLPVSTTNPAVNPPAATTQAAPGQQSGGGAAGSQPLNGGGVGSTSATTSGASYSPSAAEQASLKALQNAGLIKGDPIGSPSAVTIKDPNLGQIADPTGKHLYTFADGTTVELGPNGEIGAVTPVVKPTGADQAAQQAGRLVINGVTYVKDPTSPTGYSVAPESANQTQLSNAKTVADTNYTQAQADKARIDAALAADPTNQALQQQKQKADVAYTQAQTTKLGIDAQIAQGNLGVAQGNLAVNQGTLQLKQQTTPYDIASTQATTASTQATTAKTLAAINEPTLMQTGTGPTNTYWDPATQSLKTVPNMNAADPGALTVALKNQADQYAAGLQQQVAAGKITSDQAAQQFNDWHAANIDPMMQTVAQLQATQQADLLQKQNTAAYTAAQAAYEKFLPGYNTGQLAQTAADAAQKNAIAMMPYSGNANFGDTLGQIMKGGIGSLSPGQLQQTTAMSLPNLQEIGRMGAAQALAHISPTAQMHLQNPAPPATAPVAGLPSPNNILAASNYNFGAPPAAAAPAVANSGQAAPAAAPGAGAGPMQTQSTVGMSVAAMPGAGPGGAQSTSLAMPKGVAAYQPGTYGPMTSSSWWSPPPAPPAAPAAAPAPAAPAPVAARPVPINPRPVAQIPWNGSPMPAGPVPDQTQYAPGIGLTPGASDMNTAPVQIPWNGSPMPTGPVPYTPPPTPAPAPATDQGPQWPSWLQQWPSWLQQNPLDEGQIANPSLRLPTYVPGSPGPY